jgi:AcrR family transcriptional regulator
MDERSQRIIETAMELAERDGFAAVRLRDVAAQAGVALGTVYRRFPKKESILLAALAQQTRQLQLVLSMGLPPGETPLERVSAFFALATRGLLSKPHLARALLRSVAAADPDITSRVAGFHSVINGLIRAVLRGVPPPPPPDVELEVPEAERSPMVDLSDPEGAIGFMLQQIWFASLVGWASGLHDEAMVVEYVDHAAQLLWKGWTNS